MIGWEAMIIPVDLVGVGGIVIGGWGVGIETSVTLTKESEESEREKLGEESQLWVIEPLYESVWHLRAISWRTGTGKLDAVGR